MARATFHTSVVFNNYLPIAEKHEKLIGEALKKLMVQAKQLAKQLVPVDTSTLQKSIGYRNVSGLIYELYAGAEYAVYVEYGHGGNDYFGPQPARPYLYPAALNTSKNLDTIVGAILASPL